MDFETVTIIIAIIGTGVAITAAILPGQRDLKRSVGELRESVGELRERMARLEGLFEGFTKNPAP